MSSSNVPAIRFTDQGVVLPAETDILTGALTDINAAFGGGLVTKNADGTLALATPQGQMASSLAAIVGDKNNEIAAVVNNVDPDTATGRWQDALGRIYFMERNPAQATVVQVQCVGAAGTVIPVGATVQATDGNIYAATEAGTIPTGGSITLPFACNVAGPIACTAGMISGPYQTIPGWDSASNSADGVVGNNVESPSDFEYRRKQMVALNAKNTLASIRAAVWNAPGVLDVYTTDNPTGNPVTNGSITLPANSVYVAVTGGLDADVAAAIWSKMPPGVNMTGNTTQTVTDTEHYSAPYPTYTITYQRPPSQAILFAVNLANVAGLPSDIVTQVQNAIINAFNGTDGGPRVRIGGTVYASRFYAPVSNIAPGLVEILSLQLGTSSANATKLALDIGYEPTISAANISVTLT